MEWKEVGVHPNLSKPGRKYHNHWTYARKWSSLVYVYFLICGGEKPLPGRQGSYSVGAFLLREIGKGNSTGYTAPVFPYDFSVITYLLWLPICTIPGNLHKLPKKYIWKSWYSICFSYILRLNLIPHFLYLGLNKKVSPYFRRNDICLHESSPLLSRKLF
jgi:hypothetical protein